MKTQNHLSDEATHCFVFQATDLYQNALQLRLWSELPSPSKKWKTQRVNRSRRRKTSTLTSSKGFTTNTIHTLKLNWKSVNEKNPHQTWKAGLWFFCHRIRGYRIRLLFSSQLMVRESGWQRSFISTFSDSTSSRCSLAWQRSCSRSLHWPNSSICWWTDSQSKDFS